MRLLRLMLIMAVTTVMAGSAYSLLLTDDSSFGGGTLVQGFEGYSAGLNIPSSGGGYLDPGTVGPFTFTSGVVLTGPIPNAGRTDGVIIGDFSIGDATFGLGGYGSITSAADVPFGDAYFALDDTSATGPIVIDLASDMERVGAYVTALGDDIFMEAYNSSDVLLDSVSISSVDVSLWSTNFIGIAASGISYVTFNSDFIVMDDFKFENGDTVIPEPASMTLFGLGLGGFVIRRIRKRK